MRILIAESKTMTAAHEVSAAEYLCHRPEGEPLADRIMKSVEGMTAAEVAERMDVSGPMARKVLTLAYDYPDKQTGCLACEAFTGVVFRHLDAATLPEDARRRLVEDVRIVSSLYGLLRPDDVVKPYRLDYYAPMAPDGKRLDAWLRAWNTQQMSALLADGRAWLDLMPQAALKALDVKVLEKTAPRYSVKFLAMKPDGSLRAPGSERLKALRGMLLRHILVAGIDTPDGLRGVETDAFSYYDEESTGRVLTFLC